MYFCYRAIMMIGSFTSIHLFRTHSSGSNEPEIKRWANLVQEPLLALDQNIWQFSISLKTNMQYPIYSTWMFFDLFTRAYMGQRYGQLLQLYQIRLTLWVTRVLGAFSAFTWHSLLPVMTFVPILGNHCCQTLFRVTDCLSLAISTKWIQVRTTTELCKPALLTLLQIGDKDLALTDSRGLKL